MIIIGRVSRDTANREYGIAPPGFRLPEATRSGAVHLQVSDLSRSIAYYQQVLGLHVQASASGVATLGVGDDEEPLVGLSTAAGIRPARRGTYGLYHFAILLPDRDALGRFAAHVSTLGLRVGMADHLVSEALYLWDPDGLGIEVYADRPRGTWQRRGAELVMATDPLDVRSLIAAASGRAWDAAPAGTTMGHVHLHVGSLTEAEAFYHGALGFEKTVWSYPGALFMSAGGYHHHLATNVWSPGPSAGSDEARLLEWELVVPADDDVMAVERSVRNGGFIPEPAGDGISVVDGWGTRVLIRTTPTRLSP